MGSRSRDEETAPLQASLEKKKAELNEVQQRSGEGILSVIFFVLKALAAGQIPDGDCQPKRSRGSPRVSVELGGGAKRDDGRGPAFALWRGIQVVLPRFARRSISGKR